ncbi:MAG: diguanylate cyclase [Rhodospirillaceae bacterium]
MDGSAAEVLAALDSGVALLDPAGRITVWNPWLARASRIAEPDAIGRTLTDLFADGVAEALLEAVQSATAYGLASVLSQQLHRRPLPLWRGRGPKGEAMEQSILVRPLRGAAHSSGPDGCLIQINDVTTAVRRERHLRDSESALRLRNRAVEASSQGIIIVDATHDDLPILYANPAFTAITGWEAAEVQGRHPRFLHGTDVGQSGPSDIRQAVSESREGIAVLRNFRKDGTPFWNELLVAPVTDSKGRVTHYVGIQRDITARKEAEAERDTALAEVRAANERLSREKTFISTVLETVDALVVVLDRRGVIVSINRAGQLVTGRPEDALVGTRLGDLIPDPKASPFFRLDQGGGTYGALTTQISVPGTEPRWVRWSLTPLSEANGPASFLICTGVDVTERRRAESLLKAEREILELVARAESRDVILENLCLTIEVQMPGCRAAVLLLDDAGKTLHPAAAPNVPPQIRSLMAGVPIGAGGACCARAAFLAQPVYSTQDTPPCWSTPVSTSSSTVLGTVTVLPAELREPQPHERDVMERAARLVAVAVERHRAEERVRYLALYDPLTGLANRTLLGDRLDSAISHARRHHVSAALLFIDLDGFKAINDTHGHNAGDEVLATIGRRLSGCIRDCDTAARIGGDEFVVLLSEIAYPGDAEQVANKVLDAVRRPVSWNELDLSVGASIGIALYPDDADTADTLLTRADDAMYTVKQSGKGAVRRSTSLVQI